MIIYEGTNILVSGAFLKCFSILYLFLQIELSHFSGVIAIKVYRYWVPCVRNFFYNFMQILLKLHRCLSNALKMCMWSGYYTQIILPIFSQIELSHFSGVITIKR